MRSQRFRAEVLQGHKGPAIVVPFDPTDAWGERPRHFVEGRLNDAPFEGEIGFRRRVFYFCLDARLLRAARLAPGDAVDVLVRPRDAAPSDPTAKPTLTWARMPGDPPVSTKGSRLPKKPARGKAPAKRAKRRK